MMEEEAPAGVWVVEKDMHGLAIPEEIFWVEEDAKKYVDTMSKERPSGFPRHARFWRVR